MTEITGMFINRSGFIRAYTCTERKCNVIDETEI